MQLFRNNLRLFSSERAQSHHNSVLVQIRLAFLLRFYSVTSCFRKRLISDISATNLTTCNKIPNQNGIVHYRADTFRLKNLFIRAERLYFSLLFHPPPPPPLVLSSTSLFLTHHSERDEPRLMNRSRRSQAGTAPPPPPARSRSAMSPTIRSVDENKDLHILMNKTL